MERRESERRESERRERAVEDKQNQTRIQEEVREDVSTDSHIGIAGSV